MVNIRSKRAQQIQYRVMLRIMTNIENKFSKRIQFILDKRYRSASEAARTGNLNAAISNMRLYSDDLRRLFELFYATVSSTFGELFFRSWKESLKSWNSQVKDIELKGAIEESYWDRMRRWSKEEAGKKIKIITDNEAHNVAELISDRLEEGISHVTIAEEIAALVDVSSWEALRISRTEAHTCANASTREAAESTGVEWLKYWVSAGDSRVRETHARAAEDYSSDSPIPMDEPYELEDGDSLMYPGDSSGLPENVIFCRCVELYIAAEPGAEEEPIEGEVGEEAV